MEIMMNFESMKEIIVRAAKEAGLTEYELYYYADEDMSVGALKKEIDSFSSGNSQGIDFRCKVGGKMGYASTELFTEEELAELGDKVITARQEDETEAWVVAIDITDLPFVQDNVHLEDADDRIYFALSGNTQRPEMCRDAWEYIHAWESKE